MDTYHQDLAGIDFDNTEADRNLTCHETEIKIYERLCEFMNYPVGGDELLSRAAEAMIGVLDEDKAVIDAVHHARTARAARGDSLLSISAVLMLLSHSPNFHMFKDGLYDFPQRLGLNDPDRERGVQAYQSLFQELIRNQFDSFTGQLYTRNIQSTDPHRGAGLPGLLQMLKVLKWVDIGASTGFPVKRAAYPNSTLQALDPWNVRDLTPGSVVSRYLDTPHQLQELIAVDPVDPFADQDAIDWFVACRMPKAVTPEAVQHTRAQIQAYRNGIDFPGYKFQIGNTNEIGLPKGTYDLVTASTMMTHIDPSRRDESIRNMLELLNPTNPKSMVVIQDYARRSDEFGYGIEIVKTRAPFQYGIWLCGESTEHKFREFVRFHNSSCRGEVMSGDDFGMLMQIMNS